MDESGHAVENGKTSSQPSLGLDWTAPKNAVLLEQIRVLYRTPAVVFVILLNASLTAYVLHDLLPVRMFVGWVGQFCIVVLARFLDCRRYMRAPQQAEFAAAWGWRFAVGATATCCLWGLTGSAILMTPDPAYHAFIAYIVAGMMAGAVAHDLAYLPAMIGFGPRRPASDLRLFRTRRADVNHHGIYDRGLHRRAWIDRLSHQSMDRYHCSPRDHSEGSGRRSREPSWGVPASRLSDLFGSLASKKRCQFAAPRKIVA